MFTLRRNISVVPAAVLLLVACLPLHAGFQVQFDYTYDTNGFFNDPLKRESLEAAASYLNRYTDSLAPVISSGSNTWASFFTPPNSDSSIFLQNVPIPQDTLLVYVAGRPLSGRLAQAIDLGAVGQGDPAWVKNVANRGQTGASTTPATDFGPLGGSISFNNDPAEVPWHVGRETTGIKANEFDLVTVAMHELIHLFGFGVSRSFSANVGLQHQFVGPQAVAVGSSTNATLTLDDVDSHWRSGTKGIWNGKSQEALEAPGIFPGRRAYPTGLDRAALRDIGWTDAKAGDADRNGLFDSSDLLTVFQAGQYETGAFAGWQDGDWTDDALFESGDLVVALQTGGYEQPAAISTLLAARSHQPTSVTYNSLTGDVTVTSPSDLLTAFELKSSSRAFHAGTNGALSGPFDVDRADKLFKLQPDGFDELTLTGVLPSGWTLPELEADLTFDGAMLGGGQLSETTLRVVPEPSAVTLLLTVLPLLRRRPRV